MTTVGFIGLGRMGAPMASNLVGHVDRLLVHDLSPAAVDELVAKASSASWTWNFAFGKVPSEPAWS